MQFVPYNGWGCVVNFEFFLPVLMHMVMLQTQDPPQIVSVSPFDMNYQRDSTPGKPILATQQMLERICVAQSAINAKVGLKLLGKAQLQLQKKCVEGQPTRILIYAPDLFKEGPTINLVYNSIMENAEVDVWVCRSWTVDSKYPPAKRLVK
jgi:hypothetical protein